MSRNSYVKVAQVRIILLIYNDPVSYKLSIIPLFREHGVLKLERPT